MFKKGEKKPLDHKTKRVKEKVSVIKSDQYLSILKDQRSNFKGIISQLCRPAPSTMLHFVMSRIGYELVLLLPEQFPLKNLYDRCFGVDWLKLDPENTLRGSHSFTL